MASFIFNDQDGFSRSVSDAPPTHYTVKIQLFSLLTKNSIERYESGDFEAGGYKWKLVLYPNGNKNKNVKDHISLYLAMAESSSLPPGWEVYAIFRFFLLDQNKDNYLVIQDTMGKERRFHGMKLMWGVDQVIPLKEFNDTSSGNLVDDCCVFGAEVYVCKERSRCRGESLSIIKDATAYKHIWRVENFSKLDAESYDSTAFNVGDQKWKIQLYPKGTGNGVGNYVSLYLALADATTVPPGCKIYVDFTLRVLDQIQAKHYAGRGKANFWFSASSLEFGATRFILLSHLKQQNMGYLVRDICLVEAEVNVLGMVNAM